jgi:type VI secretion system secreted protein VgrG
MAKKLMEIQTPLGSDLLFTRMHAREELGRLFEYRLELVSAKGDIDPDKLLGKNVTLKLELPNDKQRFFNGHVTRFAQVGMLGRYHLYHATVRPWLWFLTRTADCRIFQDKDVPQIVKEVLEGHSGLHDFKQELTGKYAKREYCVQYRETDFNFVSRLLEEEGIYYYFQHTDGHHKMVITDSLSGHSPYPDYGQLTFNPTGRGLRVDQEYVGKWELTREVQPGGYALTDYDFEKPSASLGTSRQLARSHDQSKGKVFDYPGGYYKTGDGEQLVRTRLEELQCRWELCRAETNARGVAVGSLVKLEKHPRGDQNREYLVVAADYELAYTEYEAMETPGASYRCVFTALNSKEPFRPQRLTPEPIVQGPQTAVVVGPKGDEIYTDKYGRVKVQFHWDRYGKSDENSSCWIRVSHPWAGKNWGMVAIPRIGQEVVVDFLEGDPDRPLITGRVYNAEEMPPYALPANMTQTGILSRSTKGGSGANANEFRFEDKKGSEQVYLHAEKNQDIEVENDESHWVGHDRKKTIDHDETVMVKNDRTETVGKNETISIGVDRSETVGANETVNVGANRSVSVGATETKKVALTRTHMVGANEAIAVGGAQEIAVGGFQAIVVGGYQTMNVGGYQNIGVSGNQSESVGGTQSVTVSGDRSVNASSNESTSVGKDESHSVTGGRTTSIGKDDALKVGKNLVIDAGDSVTIKTGSASITMKKDGTITIKGKDITVNGSGKINVKASSDVVIKGSKVGIN